MDSKGLDVCNSLERDKAFCVVAAGMEGKRLAKTVLTVLPSLGIHGSATDPWIEMLRGRESCSR